MHLTNIDRLFWALSFFQNCILLVVLFGRGCVSSLPVFTTLIATNVVRTITLYLTFRLFSAAQYFYVYWSLAVVDTMLQLLLAYELSAYVFKPLDGWAPDVRRSFVALIGVSILLGIALTCLAAPPTHNLRQAVVMRGDFFSSVLMSELFVVMIALSVSFGLPWRTHGARVAQGYGIYAFFGVLTDAAHNYFGADESHISYSFLSHLQIALYLACLGYWIVTLAMKEPEPRKMPERLHEELRVLQRRAALVLSNLRAMGSSS